MRKLQIPSSFKPDQQVYIRDLVQSLEAELEARISKLAATNQVMLSSPSKKIYAVSVDDLGVVTSTLVQE